MSNMAEVNGSDHLVRHDIKDTRLNGYDNEGYHGQERSEDEEESAGDDDRLRAVVTENGHRPEDDSPLSNGHSTTVNGTAVIVVENANMNDSSPLDTRLHHYVSVEDVDRKILNGSDGTRVTIPEDAVINFNTGRVKVKRGASNNPSERESIPLETMLPAYAGDEKTGLGEKAELANHKNGLWSEGHNAYGNPEGAFGNSEKLNGTSKASEEVSLPVNNHRKCLRGEKLYFTEENRKLCPGWRRVFVCGLILIILAVALLLGVLAATGILLAESESKNTRYESGHSLPSIDSLSHAGHSSRPRPSSSKVPQKFLPPVTGDASLPTPNSTVSGTGDTVSPPHPTVTSKVPALNDSSHSQTIVPNALVGEFMIDENFTEDLNDKTTNGYRSLANYLERELRGIFKRNNGVFEELKILNFSPGSIKVKFVAIWASERNVIESQKAADMMKSYLRKNRNSLLAYPVDLNSIHFKDVFDECRVQKGGCTFHCIWDYNTLAKTCTCDDRTILLPDGKSCGPKPQTSSAATTTKLVHETSTASVSTSKLLLLTEESKEGTTVEQPYEATLTTTQIPTVITDAITAVSELFTYLTTTAESSSESVPSFQTFAIENQSSPSILDTVAEESTSQHPTTVSGDSFTSDGPVTMNGTENPEKMSETDNPEKTDGTNHPAVTHERTTEMPSTSGTSVTEKHQVLKEFNATESPAVTSDIFLLNATDSNLELETSTQKSTTSTPKQTDAHFVVPGYMENHNETTTILPTTEPNKDKEEAVTTIGYRIENETTEIYTLKGDTDFDLETTFTPTPERSKVTGEPTVSLTEGSSLGTSHSTYTEEVQEVTATETANLGVTTEDSKHETTSNVASYDATGMTKHTDFTDIPEHTTYTETTMYTDDMTYHTTVKDTVDEKTTDVSSLKGITLDGEIVEDNGTTLTTPQFLSNGTEEYLETTTAITPVTTNLSVPSDIPYFNRTPEVRSFDEDLENNTFTPAENLSTEEPTFGASTQINAFSDNSSAFASEADDTLLTPSSVTTPIPPQDSTSSITTLANISDESSSFGTTENVLSIMNENETTSTQNPVSVSLETTDHPFSVSSEGDEIVINTDSALELTTENSQQLGIDETSNTTISSNERETTEAESPNQASGTTEISGSIISESQSFTETSTTATPSDPSSIDIVTGISENLPESTTSFDNETGITDLFGTVTNLEINGDINANKSTSELGVSNSSEEIEENPLFNGTTSEPSTLAHDGTSFVNFFHNTTVPTSPLNESSITTQEVPGTENFTDSSNFTYINESEEMYTSTTVQDFTLPTPPTYSNATEANNFTEPVFDAEMFSTINYNNDTLMLGELGNDSFAYSTKMSDESSGVTFMAGMNESMENSTFIEDFGNFTTDGYEDVTNETTTNASTGIECREDQFLCEPLNKCINESFLCDGIADCPDSSDEFECKDTCHSNFMCANSSTCIMSDVRCDGIWDCENGTDEDNCTPNECAKHEVMCLDGSKCIKPGHICDWKYNCVDRSDEVGCVERTTCESGGRFFCNDGLCIPWSLKCDGEHDCKDGEDEGNCNCLNDEFRCTDGKCLKSSSRCDGHQDCHDADDEMGCVNVDSQHVVSTYEPYSGTWGMLCAEDWTLDDGRHLCQELGFGHVLSVEKIPVSFNGTWMAMRRDNLTDASLWTERVSFVESCTSSLAAAVECQKFQCGEYTGLLHRRKRDVISSSSSQLPFIGYTSTFHSHKGCLSEILTPIWLITSAECLLSISKEPFNGSDWYVRTKIGRNVETDLAQNHEVLRIINHPHSSKFRSLTLRDYDVALIRLKHALVFVSDKIGAICPPDEQVPPGITCFSSVLGTEKPRAPPPQSLAINFLALQIIEKENCNGIEHYNNAVNQRMLCTQSSEGHTICDNDEGTPLMCLSWINKWFLAGMLTYQRFCDVYSKHPAVFSNLFSMRKFLDQVTGQKQYEIPYDGSVYVIIPPTTPSPTLPETTTTVMTTVTTTESILSDTTFLTTMETENITDTLSGVFEEMNSTTSNYEELAREENYTSTMPIEFTTDLLNSTNELFENETGPLLQGIDFGIINTTLEESNDELTSNRTHSYLMSLLNDTQIENGTDDEINTTVLPIIQNSTDFSNVTSFDLPRGTLDLTTMPMSVESDTTTEFHDANLTSTSSDLINLFINETQDINTTSAPTMNDTTDYPLSAPTTNNSIDDFNLSVSNETTMTDLPTVSIFNDSLEMLQPMIAINESMAISQPLISITNNSKEMAIESPITLSTLEPRENSSEESMTTEANLFEMNYSTTDLKMTEIPTTKITHAKARADIETTTALVIDETESFKFEMEGEPDEDLAVYIFNSSDGLKFEPYAVPETSKTSNSNEKNISETDILNTNQTTVSPLVNKTADSLSLHLDIPFLSGSVFNTTELPKFTINNITDNFTTETEKTIMDYTSPLSFEVDTNSEVPPSLSDTEDYENMTSKPDIETSIIEVEDSEWKSHLISEELTVYQNDSSLINTTDCGIWDENAGIVNNSDSRNFFMQWPALGYLQMTSGHNICASAIVSPKFVITSLNCLTLSDNQLDPEKWAYIGGLHDANLASIGTQTHLVSKIIPHSVQSTSLLLNKHRVALVEIKGILILDEYSQNACVPKNSSLESVCFATGWSRNTSEGDFQKQFHSIPLSITSLEECNNTMNSSGMLHDSLICSKNYNESISLCQMDLGSPLFCLNENKRWEIQGILNIPSPCDTAQPTLFYGIASVRKWIIDIITNEKKLLQ